LFSFFFVLLRSLSVFFFGLPRVDFAQFDSLPDFGELPPGRKDSGFFFFCLLPSSTICLALILPEAGPLYGLLPSLSFFFRLLLSD
jgi:hypothetical protein